MTLVLVEQFYKRWHGIDEREGGRRRRDHRGKDVVAAGRDFKRHGGLEGSHIKFAHELPIDVNRGDASNKTLKLELWEAQREQVFVARQLGLELSQGHLEGLGP